MSHLMTTLNALLRTRGEETASTAVVGYVDDKGSVSKTVTYPALYAEAASLAPRVLNTKANVVLGMFEDTETHIHLFWACVLAGVPYCPLAPPHPDPVRQRDLFAHLNNLFGEPVLITSPSIAAQYPDVKSLAWHELKELEAPAGFKLAEPQSGDTVAFVLTSGSTGKPKAVTLRHEQILASVRSKSAHHGTSSASTFFNWIAFDHVASITEIHIHAMICGSSQYHIAPSAIIANPLLLLRCASSLKVGYTFSPNFLLTRLLKDASVPGALNNLVPLDLSGLRALISGGESVPLATAIAVADLLEQYGAPRNTLRAGFGMSETCAGSIYDTTDIPREETAASKPYLSLGKPVPGMEMRVASEDGVLVASGEAGHLQVRGPMLFKAYHNDVRANSSAFTPDGWFVTGDLALIDADGNLHLVGRDKDCLNINGAKLSSTDVETYIDAAHISGVSHVVVCPIRLTPTAATETYVVFYEHEHATGDNLDADNLDAIVKTGQAIARRCTVLVSMAPHTVLPLPASRFVRTALGKVSRAQLAAAYLRGEFAAREQQLRDAQNQSSSGDSIDDGDELQSAVAQIVGEVLDVPRESIRLTTNLFDHGASSMHLIRLKNVLEDRLSIAIPIVELLSRPRVDQLIEFLASLSGQQPGQAPSGYQPLICLQRSGSKPPLFLIHPGVGEVLVFLNLAHQLAGEDRPIYAVRAKGFDANEEPFATLEETVDAYTAAIQAAYPSGPYYIAGYSYGGAIAFEVCKRLGERVEWLGILNLPPHIQFRLRELGWVEILFNVALFLALIPEDTVPAVRAEFDAAFGGGEFDERAAIDWMFARANPVRLVELDLAPAAFARWIRVAHAINIAGRAFVPQGRITRALTTVFCAVPLASMGTREEYKAQRLSQWVEFADHFEMVDVDGAHHTMLSLEHCASFAAHLRGAIHRAEELARKRASDEAVPKLNGDAAPKVNGTAVTNGIVKADFDEMPVIDFTLAERDPDAYYKQLRFALEHVGFLVFSNVPGFEDEFQKEVFATAADLFGRPQEWKDALGTTTSHALRGYFRADTLPGPHKAHAEAYRFGADMPAPGEDAPFWLRLHEGPNQWPAESDLPHFREQMNTLFSRYHELNLALNKHICHILDLPPDGLDEFFPTRTVEFNSAFWHYLPLTPEMRAAAANGFVQGMHEHRDPSTFVTCLIQSRAGLQVQNHAGRWIDVPMIPGGVVCNIGMQLMKLTGGRLVATTHRVNTLKIPEDRYTIPYVLSTRLEKEIRPLPQFANPEAATAHVAPNPKIAKLMGIADPLVRSGYARLSLFPAATAKLYPKEFEEARQLGIV